MNRKRSFAKILCDPTAVLCLLILIAFSMAGIFADKLAPNDPNALSLVNKFSLPCREFPLGTDYMGRCMLSRLLYGARPTMGYAFLITIISSVIGTLAGMAAGYIGGKTDYVIMRLSDVLRAFPGIVIVMVMVTLFGVGIHSVFISMLFTRWIWYARVSRNLTLIERERASIQASHLAGSNSIKIIMHNILPAILPNMLSVCTINFGGALLSISGYSFLGLGIQPPDAEWGMMINDGRAYISTHSSMMFLPGLCILIVVLSANILGDRIRDLMEEKRT